MGHIVSVHVGSKRTVDLGNRTVDSGIAKSSVAEGVVGPLGIAGDHIADAKHHGGPDQAIYVYFAEDLAFWRERIEGLQAGAFGENLLIEGFGGVDVCLGDRFQAREVLLEVTAPRIPCSVLAAHVERPTLVKEFVEAGRPGIYCRVLVPGTIRPGESVAHHSTANLSVRRFYDAWYAGREGHSTLREALRTPLAVRMRAQIAKRLSEAATKADHGAE